MVEYFNCGGQEAEDIPGGMMGETREDRKLTRRLHRVTDSSTHRHLTPKNKPFASERNERRNEPEGYRWLAREQLLFLFGDTDWGNFTTHSVGA